MIARLKRTHKRVLLLMVALVAFTAGGAVSQTDAPMSCYELGVWAYKACKKRGGNMLTCATIAGTIEGWCLILTNGEG